MKAISIPIAATPTRRDSTESITPRMWVHFAMLKGIARNVTTVPECLIRNKVKPAIQGEFLTEGLDREESCPCLRYRSVRLGLVCVGQLDGEGIPRAESC